MYVLPFVSRSIVRQFPVKATVVKDKCGITADGLFCGELRLYGPACGLLGNGSSAGCGIHAFMVWRSPGLTA